MMHALHPDSLDTDLIRVWSGALADGLDAHAPTVPVETCGEWTLGDLVWHLTEVQRFWIHIIGNRPSGPESYVRPVRPADGDLARGLRSSADDLVRLLDAADPAEPAWSWATDQTVGFSVRRQIHEALVHGIDGLLAIGAAVPDVAPRLAADGVDELVQVMIAGTPSWATFEPEPELVSLIATDTGDVWVIRPGLVVGIEPSSGDHLSLAGYELEEAAAGGADAVIEASASELLLWMWGRRPDIAARFGPASSGAADRLRRTIVEATQ